MHKAQLLNFLDHLNLQARSAHGTHSMGIGGQGLPIQEFESPRKNQHCFTTQVTRAHCEI